MKEIKINLDKFKPREYQKPILDALENKGYRRILACMPRRSGKDLVAFNWSILECLRKPCVVYYIFPTYAQAKKVIWDSITNTGERILDYIPQETIASSNSQEMKIRFKNGSLFQLVGSDNFDCFDDKTEILTENGWKLFKDLKKGVKVATLEMGGYANRLSHDYTPTSKMIYQEPLRYMEYDYDGKLYAVKNSSIDFMVTPNHKFYVKSSKNKYKFKEISDPTIRHDMIPSTCDWEGETTKEILGYRAEDFMAFLGIYISEGSTYQNYKCNRITISQSKESVRNKIRDLLHRMGLNYVETPDRFNIENLKLYDYCSQFGLQNTRFIPKNIKVLNKDLLHILFEWLVLGDGHRCKTYTAYYSVSKELIDDVQEIIIKLGKSGNVYIKKQTPSMINGRVIKSKQTLYEVRVRHSKFKRLQGAGRKQYIHTVPYQGKVYCVRVWSGVIKVRRNGKEYWSGNSLMGTNPVGCVFSEYALQDPRAYQYIRPILAANGGWAIFIGTPRGRNHFWDLYKLAQESDSWFCYKLTLDDTKHISDEAMEDERIEMSEDMILQEYYTSFSRGVEGSYYAKYIDKMKGNHQIGQVPWEVGFNVHTAWDIGVRDSTCIIMFQTIGQTVRIIDCYEKNKEGLEHYAHYLKSLPYTWGKHFAPPDIAVKEWGSGLTRIEKAKQLGIKFEVAPMHSISDGIETVRSAFSRIWIDESKCKPLIKALENYRQEYDGKRKIYKSNPLHDWSSHMCFVGETTILTRNGVRQIMDITDGDEIMTLYGWKPCTKAIKTMQNAPLVEVRFSDGTRVKCTPEHLFLTTQGWRSARFLTIHTRILSSSINSLNILTDLCTDYGRTRNIFLKAEKNYIELFGKLLMEQFLKIATYITETLIPLITVCPTLNAFQRKNTFGFLDLMRKDFLEALETKPQSGIAQKLGAFGIKEWLKEPRDGLSGKSLNDHASYVNKAFGELIAKMGINKNSVTQTVKPLIIGDVRLLKETADVYDITVPGVRHFSLVNGAIVHNSDSMRYLCLCLPKTKDGLSPEDLDKMYHEATHGSNRFASVFEERR